MSLNQLPLFSALGDKMRWHQARQGVLAQNIANAETPGYRGQDLKRFEIDAGRMAPVAVTTATTARGHIAVGATAAAGGAFGVERAAGYETTPDGNSVTLEDQMMKVTENQMDYQAVTTLYSRSLKLLRTALGRSA